MAEKKKKMTDREVAERRTFYLPRVTPEYHDPQEYFDVINDGSTGEVFAKYEFTGYVTLTKIMIPLQKGK